MRNRSLVLAAVATLLSSPAVAIPAAEVLSRRPTDDVHDWFDSIGRVQTVNTGRRKEKDAIRAAKERRKRERKAMKGAK